MIASVTRGPSGVPEEDREDDKRFVARDVLTGDETSVSASSPEHARSIGARRLDCPESDVEVEKA